MVPALVQSSDSSLHSLQSPYQSLSGRSINMDEEVDSKDGGRENSYSSMRLQKYGFGFKTTRIVCCLSWHGIISGVLLLILITLGLLVDFSKYWIGFLGLIFSSFWLYIHIDLMKRNKENDVKEIIREGFNKLSTVNYWTSPLTI